MADKAYDRTIINPLERPLSVDINQAQSQADRQIRDTFRRYFQAAGVVTNGFLDTSLKVVENSPTGMSVLIKAGIGFVDTPSDVPSAIGGISGLDDLSPFKPLPLAADQTIAIDAAPGAGQERYDIIEVKVDRRAENPVSRDVLNIGTGLFVSTIINKTLAFALDGRNGRVVSPANSTTGIGYKVGIAAALGTAVVPSTTAGYVKLCQIYVGPSVTSILNANITDSRSVFPSIVNFLATANTWTALQTMNAGLAATGSAGSAGVSGTGGSGNANGVVGQGTGTGTGVVGTGGVTNGPGVVGTGTGSGAGVRGTGGTTSPGVEGAAGTAGQDGVVGLGPGAARPAGAAAGVRGVGAVAGGPGVQGTGAVGGSGVEGTGGATDGRGVLGVGGATNGIGVDGAGTGTGAGVRGTTSGTAGSPGLKGVGLSGTSAPLNIVAIAVDPAAPVNGDVWINSTSAELKYRVNNLTYRVVGVNP